jgi:D-arabinose 1-dehydrogenase-like Zn-dependent alcohol dehydrogenase
VHEGLVLVEAVAVGVCGTDVEIVAGKYGWAPPGKERLVLGHESLSRVMDLGFDPDIIVECTGVSLEGEASADGAGSAAAA